MRYRRAAVALLSLVAAAGFAATAPNPASGSGNTPLTFGGTSLTVQQDAAGHVTVVNGANLRAGLIQFQFSSASASADLETFQLLNDVTLTDVASHIADVGAGGATAAT